MTQARVDSDGILLEPVKAGPLTIHPPRSTPYHRIVWKTPTGQRKQTTKGRTFAEASAAADAILDDLETGTERGGEKVKDMIDNYLRPDRVRRRGQAWSDNTHFKTAWLFGKYITPQIGHMRCRALTNKALIAVVEQTPAPSADTQKRLRAELGRLVKDGYEQGYLSVPPEQLMRGVRSAGKGEVVVARHQGDSGTLKRVARDDLPNAEEIEALATAMRGHWPTPERGELLVYLAAYAGPRLGEFLALRAGDFDTATRQVRIDRQVLAGGKKVTLPKGGKKRVSVYPQTTPATKANPEGWPLAAKLEELLEGLGGESVLFPAPRGGMWNHSNFYERAWGPAYSDAGWPTHPNTDPEGGKEVVNDYSPHTLRHVAAVYWLWDRGKSARAVAEVLGHGSTTITLSVYGERGTRLDEFAE